MATAPVQSIDFARMMGPVAQRLLGDHNKALSRGTRLRWGNKGSMEIDTADGWFDDHEANARGGVLELIRHKLRCDNAGAFRWLEEQGLKPAEVMPIPQRERVFYDYCDEDGAVLFRVERRGKNASPPFLQHGPDGNGGFHSARGCMQGVRRVPYRLPELLASSSDTIVFVTEGEKDADRLASLGLVATTNPGGAGKFTTDYAPYLRGRRVVLLEDNDDAGRNHVEVASAALTGIVAQAVPLKLDGLAAKGDVSDWLEAGHSVAELLERAEQALIVTSDSAVGLLPMLDPSDWIGVEAPDQKWALAEYIPWQQATYFTGPGSVGKSLLTQLLCTCIAVGIPFLGVETTQTSAMYVTCEDDPAVLHRRQKAICRSLGISLADLSGKLHLVSLMGELGNELCTFDASDRLVPSPRFQQMVKSMEVAKVGFVAVDNVAHLFPEEISRNKVAAQVNLLNRLARDMDAAVLFLGHPNKEGAEYSGSTAWENQVRSRLYMGWEEGDAPNPDGRVLRRSKSNYAAKGGDLSFIWHEGCFVRLGDLPESTGAQIAQISIANGENTAFMRCLDAATKAQRAVSHNPGSNYAPKTFAAMPEAKGMTIIGFKRAMERLIHLGEIQLDQPLWRGPNRVMKQGIKAASTCTNPPQKMAENRAPTPARTPCTNPHETPGNPARFNPPYTTYNTGAAHEAAAPVQNRQVATVPEQPVGPRGHHPDQCPQFDPNITLAPGECHCDPVPGWDEDKRPRF